MKKLADVLKEKYKNSDQDIILDGADFISQKGYTLIPNYVLHAPGLSPYAKLYHFALQVRHNSGTLNAV